MSSRVLPRTGYHLPFSCVDAGRADWYPPRAGRVRLIIDTDAGAEIDDQFAIAYCLSMPDRLHLRGITTAPFDGPDFDVLGSKKVCEQTLEELFDLVETRPECGVYRGATAYRSVCGKAESSDATEFIIREAEQTPPDEVLYLIGIGPATNLAAAIELAPQIVDRVVVIWLGGHSYHWPGHDENNLCCDPDAARILFASPVKFVHIPCRLAADQLCTTRAELVDSFNERSSVCRYLLRLYDALARERDVFDGNTVWSKVIWDIAPLAWLVNSDWVTILEHPRPAISSAGQWLFNQSHKHLPHRVAVDVVRDQVFQHFFRQINALPKKALPKTQHNPAIVHTNSTITTSATSVKRRWVSKPPSTGQIQ